MLWQKPKYFLTLVLALLAISVPSQARVFSYSDSWLVAYIRGSGGTSYLSDNAYSGTSGTGIAFGQEADYNFGGEIGLAVLLSERLTLRFGVEGLAARTVTDEGEDPDVANTDVEVKSRVQVFNPMATAEFVYLTIGGLRLFSFAGIGYATVKVTNDYVLGSAMATEYNYTGESTYKESWRSSSIISWQLGTGLEYALLDNVTVNLDVGWRFLEATKFYYSKNQEVIRGNTSPVAKDGQVVRDNANRAVSLDMGGPFVGLAFKFYIPNFN